MKTLSPEKSRKLRGLIAKALDEAASTPEKRNSAMAACRLLGAWGLGVEGDETLELALLSPSDRLTAPSVVVVNMTSSDGDERKARYTESLFSDLFGGAGFGKRRK